MEKADLKNINIINDVKVFFDTIIIWCQKDKISEINY